MSIVNFFNYNFSIILRWVDGVADNDEVKDENEIIIFSYCAITSSFALETTYY